MKMACHESSEKRMTRIVIASRHRVF